MFEALCVMCFAVLMRARAAAHTLSATMLRHAAHAESGRARLRCAMMPRMRLRRFDADAYAMLMSRHC